MEKWWDFAAAGLALVAAGCWFLSASGQLPAMPTVIRSFKRLNSQRDGTASQRAFRDVGAWHVRRPAHQAERRLNPSSHPILVANPCFTELLPQLPFLSPDEKIDQRNVDGGDDECGG